MLYILENNYIRVEISSLGGNIEKIINKKTGNNHYWEYDSELWPRRTSVCFPVCGGVAQGKYLLNEKEYEMPQHGFLRETCLVAKIVEKEKLCLVAQADENTKRMYPFEFLYEMIFELNKEVFTITYVIHNNSKNEMLYSTGAHYTYAVPIDKNGSYEHYVIQIGNKTMYLKDDLFVNGAILIPSEEIDNNTVKIKSLQSVCETEVQFDGFPYCILWSKPGIQPFVCIEPWAGLSDDMNKIDLDLYKKKAIRILKPSKSEKFVQTIKVK